MSSVASDHSSPGSVEKQAAGARSMVASQKAHRAYNDWASTQFGLYSWGASSCNSYYQLPNGRAPFLFPGNFKTYDRLHDEIGLQDFDLT